MRDGILTRPKNKSRAKSSFKVFSPGHCIRAKKNFCPEVKKPTGDLGSGSRRGTVDRTTQASTDFHWGP